MIRETDKELLTRMRNVASSYNLKVGEYGEPGNRIYKVYRITPAGYAVLVGSRRSIKGAWAFVKKATGFK